MSEIAKCPLCGKDVKKSIWRPEYEGRAGSVVITVKCCGIEAIGIELWNRYAAAMELAYRYAESLGPHAEERQAHIAMKDHPDYLKLAQAKSAMQELRFARRAARAEVDRLLEEK